jgi:hypothetical protein
MAPSVLLIGAGGTFGTVALKEFIRQRKSFGRIAVLTSESRVSAFELYKNDGIETIAGSWSDPSIYTGKAPHLCSRSSQD